MHPDDPGIMGLTLETGRAVVAGADPGPLLSRIAQALPTTLGVAAAAIVLLERPESTLSGVWASGADAAHLGGLELRSGNGPVQAVVRSGRSMVVPDLTRLGPPELAAAAAEIGLVCSVVVPLLVEGEAAGGLQLFGHPRRPVGEGHADAVAGLAEALSARLTDAGAVRRLTGTVARLTAEYEAAIPVAHATGMLAERYRTDPEEAGRYLDSRARKTGLALADAARAVLDRTDRTPADAPTTALALGSDRGGTGRGEVRRAGVRRRESPAEAAEGAERRRTSAEPVARVGEPAARQASGEPAGRQVSGEAAARQVSGEAAGPQAPSEAAGRRAPGERAGSGAAPRGAQPGDRGRSGGQHALAEPAAEPGGPGRAGTGHEAGEARRRTRDAGDHRLRVEPAAPGRASGHTPRDQAGQGGRRRAEDRMSPSAQPLASPPVSALPLSSLPPSAHTTRPGERTRAGEHTEAPAEPRSAHPTQLGPAVQPSPAHRLNAATHRLTGNPPAAAPDGPRPAVQPGPAVPPGSSVVPGAPAHAGSAAHPGDGHPGVAQAGPAHPGAAHPGVAAVPSGAALPGIPARPGGGGSHPPQPDQLQGPDGPPDQAPARRALPDRPRDQGGPSQPGPRHRRTDTT